MPNANAAHGREGDRESGRHFLSRARPRPAGGALTHGGDRVENSKRTAGGQYVRYVKMEHKQSIWNYRQEQHVRAEPCAQERCGAA
jgi:hypothetical protein